MKKILYILSLLLLGLVSCNKAELEGLDTKKAPESGLVEVTMKLTVPTELTAVTKANNRDVTPHIDHIRVAVFGTSGYPQAYALAEPATGENQPVAKYADVNGSVFYFKVLLPVYEGEAHVHIIANGDENIQFVDMTEDKIMTTMKTTGDVGAYWARVVLPDGILTIKDENGIMQTDQESGNFIPSAETARLFEDLVLVRNFAQVTLDNDADNFVVDSWTLVNTPQYGSVAPVSGWADVLDDNGDPVDADEDGNTDQTAVYVENYKDYVYNVKTGKMVLAELDEDGYVMDPILATYDGYMVPGSDGIVTDIPDESSWTKGTQAFVYERIDPQKVKPTCILLKGYYDGETTATYYRIDLMDENLGGYFPLYRNYNYQITISEVGNRGAADAATAMLRDSGGNVSMTAEAQTLTDISDGKSRLYVEYVDKTFVTGTSAKEKSFWVYYIPDVTATYEEDVVRDGVTVHKEGDPIIDNSKITEVKISDAGDALVLNGTLTKDTEKSSDDGMYVYNFTLNAQSASKDLTSVFHVEADNGLTGKKKSKLVRDITVRVMKQMSMSLRFEPNPADGEADAKTVLHISLSDTLQQSMFPLEFHIEDVNHTLNPTGKDDSGLTTPKNIDVPVKTAKSLADGTTNSFYFIRTVNWSEYKPMRDAWKTAKENGATAQELANIIDFRTEFKTLVPASQTKVYVENEYFTTASVDLIKPAIRKTGTATFTGANFQQGSNRSATIGPITVNFSLISTIWSSYVEVSASNTTTMTVTPTSSASMQGVTITGISLSFYDNRYNPSSISSNFTGGTGNSSTATYNGEATDQPVVATMTARNNREFDLGTITVEYSYVEGE